MEQSVSARDAVVVEHKQLQALLEALFRRGYEVVGPTIRDGAIVYDTLTTVDQLPAGWTDKQDGGAYQLKRRSDGALFGYVVGPHSWKKYLHPPRLRLWTADRSPDGFHVHDNHEPPPKRAFLGVRACELHAIHIQDRVFLDGEFVDPAYARRREQTFVVAVNCAVAGGTCFCASMNTGPAVGSGYDLALTEIVTEARHDFVVRAGSARGDEVLAEVPSRAATDEDLAEVDRLLKKSARHMGRRMSEADRLPKVLAESRDHPRWEETAKRCLTCANCTMVCPTCFCSTVEDVTDLTGEHAERWRVWDSCFTMDFSYIHGGSVRSTTASRYRQWMTHKLSTWVDQFGVSGCVGCGRCITWCPVGIDLTEEAAALLRQPHVEERRP